MKRILLLGATGTVGSAVFKQLSSNKEFNVIGTYFSALQEPSSSMIRFCVESPHDI